MSRRIQPSRATVRRVGWLAVTGLLLAAFAAPAAATRDAGNNGTVKIHEGATESEPIVRNEPHVCTFHLHFFFADPFQAGAWEIQEWSPGDKGTVVLAGTYDTNGDGEDRRPAQGAYGLPDGHYKLFWDGDADKHDKHKVFWVDCGDVAGETTTTSSTTSSTTTTDTTVTTTTTATTSTITSAATTTGAGQDVLGETGAPAPSGAGGVGEDVGGIGDVVGPGATLPPTDMEAVAGPDSEALRHLLIATAVLLGIILVLAPAGPATQRGRR